MLTYAKELDNALQQMFDCNPSFTLTFLYFDNDSVKWLPEDRWLAVPITERQAVIEYMKSIGLTVSSVVRNSCYVVSMVS